MYVNKCFSFYALFTGIMDAEKGSAVSLIFNFLPKDKITDQVSSVWEIVITVIAHCQSKIIGIKNFYKYLFYNKLFSILTSNIYTYTGDQRFSIVHPPDSDDYDLKIEYAQQRDSGIYECQVNTEPKINLAVHLEVTGKSLYSIYK